ncbi:MAG: ZIP family metal transporter [Verrucomicrobiota bacterium]
MTATPILSQIFSAFAIAMAGGAFSGLLARTHKQLCAFISLGAGTLLGVSLCGIAPECWEDLGWWLLPVAASGYLLFAIITKYIFQAGLEESEPVKLSILFAICVHKFPEGLALGALLLGGGYPRKRMLWLVALVEAMTIVGGLLGWFVLQNVPQHALKLTLALMLANAAGGFLYLAIHAVLGEIWKHHKVLVLSYFGAGFGLIAALILYFHISI